MDLDRPEPLDEDTAQEVEEIMSKTNMEVQKIILSGFYSDEVCNALSTRLRNKEESFKKKQESLRIRHSDEDKRMIDMMIRILFEKEACKNPGRVQS